ncbi:uncharacterized protein LOC100209286 [Hydra vulgaris]|uniref:uncharacterized protein LOC100209286 n=1 Tax=Hydra vulgaris TaxID=6087 RepID=UPI000192565F|nr:uncharacterized protein LOC100209286 [Hydra vulgaris]
MWFIKYAILSFASFSFAQLVDYQQCVNKLSNGCSIPLNLPFPYKEVFLPACIYHDVCYHCGRVYNWTRNQCDLAFKTNMKNLCLLKESLQLEKYNYKVSLWDRLISIFHIASQLLKWTRIKSGTLEHCNHGADVYYSSVDRFAHNSYAKGDQALCQLPCARIMGNPQNFI